MQSWEEVKNSKKDQKKKKSFSVFGVTNISESAGSKTYPTARVHSQRGLVQ